MYEINHYLRILDGDSWCVDSPLHPSVQEVLSQIETQNQKWLKSSSLEEKAYHDEFEETRKVLGSSTSLSAQKQQAVKTATMRLETYLEDVFATSSHAAGKAYLRDYADGPKKDAPTQVDTIALKFRFTRQFVLSKANELGIMVLSSPPQHQPDPALAQERKQPAQPPSWVWNARKNEVDSKFGKTTWDIPRVRLELIPGRPEDLYRFLGKTNGSSIQDLAHAKQEALGLWDSVQAPGKTANQNECGKKLCASAELWLGTEDDKALYDAMLRLDHGGVFDFLWDVLNHWTEKVGGITVISDDLWDEAVRRVRKNTRNDEEAEWLVWYQLSEKKKCKCLPPDISGLIGEIERLLANNQFQKAYEVTERALKKSPNDKTAQEYLHQAEEALAKELAAASAAIQAAVDSGDYSAARRKVDETSRKNLPGFKADEWRQRIAQAEAKAKAEKLEADRKKAKEQYEAALNGGHWMEAEKCARERDEKLGDGKLESYKAEIDQWKAKRREKLEEACTKAIDDFKRNLSANPAVAEAALSSAGNALKALEKEFRSSSVIGSTRAAIAKGRDDLAAKKRENLLNGLPPVQSLRATGSGDGKPTVTISWKPGSGETQVAKWRLTRIGRNQPFPDIDGTTTRFEDSSADLKVGIEYVYEISPLAETGKNRFAPNEKAAVRSAPTVCLAKLATDSLRGKGEGEKGSWGAVTLRWSLPSGVDVRSELAKLFLSRTDGAIQDLDVTHKGGVFVDESVSVGQSPEYRLSFVLAGKQSGTSSIRVPVEQMRMPEPVRELRAVRLPVGRWLVEWSWPTGMEQALVAPVAGTVTDGAQLESASGALPVTLETYNAGHGVEVFVPPGADRIAVCTFKDRPGGGGRIHSKPETVPVTTKQAQTTVFYGFTPKTGGLFRKSAPATAVIWSDTGILPDLVLVEGRTRRPSRKDDGTVVAEIPKHRLDVPERIVLSDAVDTDRMKLFLAKPDRDVEQFKILLPVAVPKNLFR